MYNIFKNKVFGALCYSYVKDSFKCFPDEYDIEEIYYSNDRLFVVVKNKTIGKKLYSTLKRLTSKKTVINTQDFVLRFKQFVFDKNRSVEWFSLEVQTNKNWNSLLQLFAVEFIVRKIVDKKIKMKYEGTGNGE